ncbi:MAG: leucine-rich repeat domain-containing protein [Clostridiales bacterium]|nr:leucine-rich repeat domain-containing protein [Clostridiales bacterium]
MFTIDNGVLLDYDFPELDVVVLPEGVKVLEIRSLACCSCRKLVMPSTLKVIGEFAFEYAEIDVIDFGDCKLDYIGHHAFYGCNAKIKGIPDSVTDIGDSGVYNLNIGKGKTIKLPSSLRKIGLFAINFDGKTIVEADESLLTSESGLYSSILSTISTFREIQWLQIKVFREKQLVQEFVISGEFCSFADCDELIGESGINYQIYDEWFDKVRDKQCKQKMALFRQKWPIDLSDDLKKKYTSYLSMVKILRYDDNKRYMTETYRRSLVKDLLPCHLAECLEDAERKKDVEMIAYWLEIINRRHGGISKSLEL